MDGETHPTETGTDRRSGIPADDGEAHCELGLLLVHGIGNQQRGQTLTQFSEPIVDWLKERFEGINQLWGELHEDESNSLDGDAVKAWRDRVEARASDGIGSKDTSSSHRDWLPSDSLTKEQAITFARRAGCDVIVGHAELIDARISTPTHPDAPAHAKIALRTVGVDGGPRLEHWLLAESHWAATFSPPGFSDIARWSLRIVPWTLGSHFGAQIRRTWGQRPIGAGGNTQGRGLRVRLRGCMAWCLWLCRFVAAIGWFSMGLAGSLPLLILLQLLVVVGLIPIPQIRSTLYGWQQRISSTLGDSYVLLDRPIEAASIIGHVRRDLDWLARQCEVVAIVAHSQGAAVAHEALRSGGKPDKLKLLFTFGSGLKKLEELRELTDRRTSYLWSAFYTPISLLFSAGLIWMFLSWLWHGGLTGLSLSKLATSAFDVGVLVIEGLVATALAIAGIWDHLTETPLPRLKRWTQRLFSSDPNLWTDCYATADPVSNGIALTEAEPISHEVVNGMSLSRDHTSYWENRDEFVSLLLDRIEDCRERSRLSRIADLSTDKVRLRTIGQIRRFRVWISKIITYVFLAALIVAVMKEWQAWEAFLDRVSRLGEVWLFGVLGLTTEPLRPGGISWPALGWLALAIVPYWATRAVWRSWNEGEMSSLVRRFGWNDRGQTSLTILATALFFQIVFAEGMWFGSFPPSYAWWLSFVPMFVVIMVSVLYVEPLYTQVLKRKRSVADGAGVSRSQKVVGKFEEVRATVMGVLAPLIAVAAIVYYLVEWVASLF